MFDNGDRNIQKMAIKGVKKLYYAYKIKFKQTFLFFSVTLAKSSFVLCNWPFSLSISYLNSASWFW